MFEIDTDKTIHITRGDGMALDVTAGAGETAYTFQPGDVVRFSVMKKGDCDDVLLQKDFPVGSGTTTVQVFATGNEMKFAGAINKPTDFWYEIELNPDSPAPQTIIGYDKVGPKILKLYPEGCDE